MLPSTSNNYISNRFRRDPICSGNFALINAGGAQFADFPYVLFGKSSGINLLSVRLSPFIHLVLGVLLSSCRKEMMRIATRRVITFVTNVFSFVDSSVEKLICNTVGIDLPAVDLDPSISPTGFHSLPLPTFRSGATINLSPKPDFKGYDSVHISHINIVPYTHYQGKVMP